MPEGRTRLQTPLTKGVLLTGTIGAGKSALAEEIHEVLEERGARSAVVDVDWLGWTTLPNFRELMYRNLAAVWHNYSEAGLDYLVLARLIEFAAEVDAYRNALPGVDLQVLRVDAEAGLVRQRLERRDTGAVLEEHLVDSARFAATLSDLDIADHVVVNDERPIRAVAEDALERLGWNTAP